MCKTPALNIVMSDMVTDLFADKVTPPAVKLALMVTV
jgi:hypothetical protein